jgi:hypothetical protein
MVNEKFMTKASFSKEVETLVFESRDISYMDAVLHLCKEKEIEPEDGNKYLTSVIKSKIEAEARKLNYLPRTDELNFDN